MPMVPWLLQNDFRLSGYSLSIGVLGLNQDGEIIIDRDEGGSLDVHFILGKDILKDHLIKK